MKITVVDKTAYIETPYNPEFVKQIKVIGGARWDAAKRQWKIPATEVDQAREIMRRVYGECDIDDDVKKVDVKLTFSEDVISECRSSVIIFGKQIARAFGRDDGAAVGNGVVFLTGMPASGGSRNNWVTRVNAGSVVLLHGVPEDILSEQLPEGVTYEIVSDKKDTKPTTLDDSLGFVLNKHNKDEYGRTNNKVQAIREMSDDELAAFLNELIAQEDRCPRSVDGWKEWLGEEIK